MPRRTPAVRHARWLASAVLLTLGATACASNPVTGHREVSLMSEADEIRIGREGDTEIRREMGVYADEELQRYVSGVGERLAQISHRPSLPWSFTVVDVPVINAFALPGGYVYITRGLLAHLGDEAELAGVLGHEIGHVTARHASQQYTRSATGGIGVLLASIFVPGVRPFSDLASAGLGTFFLKYGREDELEADRLGMEYSAKAGWEPQAVPRFLTTLSRIDAMSPRGLPNWLSTHPEPGSRVTVATPVAAKFAAGEQARNRDDFLRRIDGLAYGDAVAEGVVRGHQFLQPDMRIALDFPEGWDVQNGSEQVVAQPAGDKTLMLLRTASAARTGAVDEGARRDMKGLGFTFDSGALQQVNGLDAFVGVYRGKAKGMGAVRVRAAHIVVGRQVYMVAGVAADADFARVDADFTAAIDSFRELTAREAGAVRPNRVALYDTRAGDSWQSIAQRAGQGLVPATRLALMNGFAVNAQPPAGQRLKIIVAD